MKHILTLTLPLLILMTPVFALAGTQTFTSSGTFTVPAGVTDVHVLVVGGGGGGGADRAGGGGGGGFIDTTYPVTPGDSIPVTVGAGGAGGAPYFTFINNGTSGTGYQGGNSVFGTLTAVGGGAGRGPDNTSADTLRLNGGSGGGANGDNEAPGAGTCKQGNDGGNGIITSNVNRLGGGGGGAGAPGPNATAGAAGNGGDGLTSTITGSAVVYAGGGGGGQLYCLGQNGSGGVGGGGSGTCSYGSVQGAGAGAGSPNTGGGGGGGGGWDPGGAGASGIVVVAWSSSNTFSDVGGTGGSAKSCAAPVSCSIAFSPSTLSGGSSTMTWTSSGADLFYINQVGYVGASGSVQVSQTGDYSGTVSGAGGVGSCAAILSGPGGGNNNSCVSSGSGTLTCNATTGNLTDSCGNTTSCRYGCSTVTNQCNASCQTLLVCDVSGTKVVNVCDGSTVHDCSTSGQMCVAGQCILPAISFQYFSATDFNNNSFTATGHLQASPSLVRMGDTARVYWNVVNAKSCTVTGSNGDGILGSGTGIWNTRFSDAAGKTTSPITGATTYTLTCQALTGAIPPTVQESATIHILPSFQEI